MKNSKYVYYGSQLRDDVAFAKTAGLEVVLKVRKGATLSKPLLEAELLGDIIIVRGLYA